ncbi:hypothetical protein [Streptomyces sp. NPDC029554]|uniref:hypothetical protein n=1 Tax=Streptomyces sp. NPDC029554 TaxID=3155126 RepID=UPI0033C2A919
MLPDLRSTKYSFARGLLKQTANQVIGYLLLDTADRHRIDTLGFYATRSRVLANWRAEDPCDLLGTCRRHVPSLRTVVADQADAILYGQEEEDRSNELPERLAPVIEARHRRAGLSRCPPPRVDHVSSVHACAGPRYHPPQVASCGVKTSRGPRAAPGVADHQVEDADAGQIDVGLAGSVAVDEPLSNSTFPSPST